MPRQALSCGDKEFDAGTKTVFQEQEAPDGDEDFIPAEGLPRLRPE